MAVVLGAGTVMAAASTGDNGLQKEETVYVNTTAGGEVTDVTVSDWLKMLKGDHLGTAVTNFGHWSFDIQVADLYRFMRKILEKYNWNLELAGEMLREYHKIRPISAEEWKNLRVRFTYPEKYWKLANYYYSHKKVWISEKNVEKLQNLIRQRETWENFAEECFRDYPRYCSLRSQ